MTSERKTYKQNWRYSADATTEIIAADCAQSRAYWHAIRPPSDPSVAHIPILLKHTFVPYLAKPPLHINLQTRQMAV